MSLLTVNLRLVSPYGTADVPMPATGRVDFIPATHGKYDGSLRSIERVTAQIIDGEMQPVELTPAVWKVTITPTKGNPWPEMIFELTEGMPEPVNLASLVPDLVIEAEKYIRGEPGPTITNWEDNGDGTITFVMSDGTRVGPGTVPAGEPGEPGRGITSISDPDDQSQVTITYTDGTTSVVQAIAGAPGETPTVEWLGTSLAVGGVVGPDLSGPAGLDGLSAYEVAAFNGFTGTEAEWLESLKPDPNHTHDDRYYTETEVDTLLSSKQDSVSTTDQNYTYAIVDESNNVALGVNREGHTHLNRTDTSDIKELHMFILAGQSNMSGRARPYVERDTTDRRIFQYGSTRKVIERATVPLDMHDTPLGMSYSTVFAREYLKKMPEGVALLLVPCAHGGTGFTTTTESPAPTGYSTNTAGTWQVGYTASTANLYDQMLDQISAAIVAAENMFNITPEPKGLLWHQGENDAYNGITKESYETFITALLDGVRSHVSSPNLPVVVGGMVPEWIDATAGASAVDSAHKSLLVSRSNTAFVPGKRGTGQEGDIVHYGLDGVEYLGAETLSGYYNAVANDTTFPLTPVSDIYAYKASTNVYVSWRAPLCRVSHYDLEYRIDGGAWTSVVMSDTHSRGTTITGVADGLCEVRVGTDFLGSVAWSQPKIVIGA